MLLTCGFDLQPHQLRALMDFNAMDLTGLDAMTFLNFSNEAHRARQDLCVSRLQSDRRSMEELYEEARWDPSRPRTYTKIPLTAPVSAIVVPSVPESVLAALVAAPSWQLCPKCSEAAHVGSCREYSEP